MRRLYESIIKPSFERTVVEQHGLFSNEKGKLDSILDNFVPWEDLRNDIRQRWKTVEEDSVTRWRDFEITIYNRMVRSFCSICNQTRIKKAS